MRVVTHDDLKDLPDDIIWFVRIRGINFRLFRDNRNSGQIANVLPRQETMELYSEKELMEAFPEDFI